MPLLEVKDLRVGFPAAGRMLEVVRGVSFTLEAGEALGLVGESGSGKSQTVNDILVLIPSLNQKIPSVKIDRITSC